MSSETDILKHLKVWDVIFPHDRLIYPPKFKMWVCVSRQRLWFLRINSDPITPPAVELRKEDHPFLDHDSWFGGGGDLIMLPAVELEMCLKRQEHPKRQGIVGRIAAREELRHEIIEAIRRSPRLSPFQKETIVGELSRGLR